MADKKEGSEQDDVSFLRTEDMVCLQCIATGERVCLAAEGFGNRHCYLETIADKNYPPDLSTCVFVIEQALSVRALQEMVTAAGSESGQGTQSGHRTLLYGHAVLLRHQNSNMYLACLSTSSSNDKLAFDVGLQDHCQGEACWWTIHPASKQRSEGEKVRVGDDLILVSVATERYLHTAKENAHAIVNASFHVTHWSVAPFGTGASRAKSVGFVFGGEVLRFFHGGDECLTIPPSWSDQPGQNIVVYEGGAVVSQARSLWRLELARTKWSGGYINWSHPLRIRHITTGLYLSLGDNNEICLVNREQATVAASTFCLRPAKDDQKIVLDDKDIEVPGVPITKYGDTTVFVQHCETGLWLSYRAYETKKKGVGKVEEKQAILHEEGKMDDGLEFSRSQEEESRTARVIRICGNLFNKFIRGLDSLQNGNSDSLFRQLNLTEMVMCLEDLINYFAQPEDDIEHEEKQNKLRALRNRQDLFQEEGILNLILDAIDKINIITSHGYLVSLAGDETGHNWEIISAYLYQLLAAIIKGNHTNCAQFAQSHRLNWLFSRLGSQATGEGTGMLDVLHCVLIDSPEALNMMKEEHIKVIISLLEKHGRDPKVLDVLSSLCVGNGVAVRSSQNNICDHLLPGRNLLLQTQLVDHVASMRPMIFIGKVDNSTMYRKWYYEATLDHLETVTHLTPHMRIGWANMMGYMPYPGGGEKWGGNGVGDDLYSYGFDGANLWTGGRCNNVNPISPPYFQKGDVIGCAIDLNIPMITFTLNGVKVKGCFNGFNTDGMFFPVISVSAKLSCRFLLGGDQGRLKYGPPEGFSPLVECLLPNQALTIEPCFYFGDLTKGVLAGPSMIQDDTVFVPVPVDTSGISLPPHIETIRDKLAENIHELWALNKIDAGWSYGEKRDDIKKKHPCLTSFERLPPAEKRYDSTLALQTLKTILSLGYHITVDKPPARIRSIRLHNEPYLQPNGYKPAPLDLSAITLTQRTEELVDHLAENTHNIWAKERIQQGWTYGLHEDNDNKRSPHLVPYNKVDEAIKKANRDTASETVRTLLAYGYNLEPPAGETPDSALPGKQDMGISTASRTFRAEKTYSVTSGKWYFEFEVLTAGPMKVGWARDSLPPGIEIGNDENSWAFDGFNECKYYGGNNESYGKQWQVGDVVGLFLDLNDGTISFSLNGELMMDTLGGETAFSDVQTGEGFVPACTLGLGQRARLTFGQDINTLKYFTSCGLQEGYQPFCVNMNRAMTFWYNKDHPAFENTDDVPDCKIEVTRIPAGSDSPPSLKISHKTFETMEKANWEFLRLSLPVTCKTELINENEKSRNWQEIRARQRRRKAEMENIRRTPAQIEQQMLKSGFSISDIKGLQRGYSDETHDTEDRHHLQVDVKHQKRKSISKTQSLDYVRSGGLPNGLPDSGDEGAEQNLSDDEDKRRRGKSPFRFFKKQRDQSSERPLDNASATSPMTLEVPTEHSIPVPSGPSLQVPRSPSARRLSQGDMKIVPPRIPDRPGSIKHGRPPSYMGEDDGEGGDYLDDESLDLINEYYYGVRIFPGQDPNHVFVGWVTTQYHMSDRIFDPQRVRRVTYLGLESDNVVNDICERQNCYMVSAGELLGEVTQQESGARASQGMYIGCFIDSSTGYISFTCEGKATKHKYQMEPGTKLFPAIFVEATSKEVLQFELGRTKTTLPLSAAVLQSVEKHLTPQCPPRLKVQALCLHQWARVPNISLRVHSLKLSDVRGWSMLCEDFVSMLALHIPEEDRCIDILELIEQERLLIFHAHTLSLYGAVCFQGNYRAAHMLCQHVDQKQLLYAIQSEYMSGPLRIGFYDLLVAIHLEPLAYARSITQSEYIIPLGPEIKSLYETVEMAHSLRTLATVSIRPQMHMSEVRERVDQIKDLGSPFFPVEVLKHFVMSALDDAVKKGNVHNRDPIGGSMENMFVPLIKIVDKLLLIELVEDSDLQNLLILIDPTTWDENYDPERDADVKGLLQMHLDEGVKLQMCYLLQHLCDLQFRHRIEFIVAFSDDYVGEIQVDQLRRYIEIKQADLPSAVAAKKTREFRCPPKEQMSAILSFKNLEDDSGDSCPCNEELREKLNSYHSEMMKKVSVKKEEGGGEEEEEKPKGEPGMWSQKLNKLISIVKKSEESLKGEESEEKGLPEDIFRQVLITTIVKWAEENLIESNTLVREMFNLLLRQYDGVGELIRSLRRAYVISNKSRGDIAKLLQHLGIVRALLPVQMGPEEEELLRVSLWALVSNRIFFQHPDLIRILCVHEDVMAVMMNTLGRRAQTQLDVQAATTTPGQAAEESKEKDTSHEMVVACCRFLCYFCRSSKQNQKAMFDHFSFLIDNSNILLARPSLRGSTPLDVAYSSLMDNNELALALREHLLEKIAIYLSRCGLQTNQELLEKGYPDIGWDPVEGERYLDFLRFCVWVNGESVEENANLVIRLLIRRPECLGPALRGEGEGLLQAIYEANIMSERINSIKNTQGAGDVINIGINHPVPNDEDEDYIDMGASILNFYCVLVDLLGRCAPDASTIEQGKNESLRARAILRSLVPLEDLEGVLGIQFTLLSLKKEENKSDMPTGLVPNHKQSIVMFLERVYGIEDQEVFFRLLENAFLPDLRAATMLEKPEGGESDMALALNRYIGNSILPLLIKYCKFFGDADNYASLLDATLHTVYRLSKCKLLTKGQREAVSDFLVALTREMQPSMLLPLLRKLTTDVSALTEYTTVALRLLTLHFERCSRYYGAAGGQGLYGSASEEEKRLTMMLFSNIFDSLAKMEYDPELFGKALPCLSAIGCALPPDYSLTIGLDDEIYKHTISSEAGPYNPQPVNTSDVQLNQDLIHMAQKFSEHYHDAWASRKFENGWTYGEPWSDETKTHPRLRPYSNLTEWEKERYKEPIRDALKALLALGWQVEMGESEANRAGKPGLVKTDSQDSAGQGYNPRPVDMSNLTLSREMQNMAERLSENAHDIWAQKKKEEIDASGSGGIHPQMVPYDLLTDKEKRKNRERSQELLKYLQFQGCRIQRMSKPTEGDQVGEAGLTERRFAYSLLEKLLQYLDVAAFNMKLLRPSGNQSRRNSFKTSSRDVKFFSKVVLPLMEKYFSTHRNYFIAIATAISSTGAASLKEKEMVASLFCKLAALLRAKISAFGNDARITVRCLQVLIRAFDAKSIVKSCPEFVRTSMLTFFNNAAEDLAQAVNNLKQQRYSYIRGTALKTSSSLNYIQMVILPILTALYDHLAANEYGADLLLDDLQVACYKILNSLYTMGTDRDLFNNRKFIMNELDRHRPALGTCLGAFASTFPVAFLEPHLNKHNQYSIHGRLQEHSLEAQDIMARLESSMPTLEDLMSEVDRYAESGGSYEGAPHVIDVELPMLCSYLPFWWYQGPDNVSTQTGNYVTMVTSEHMNNLLKTVLVLIKNNVGSEQAPWMTRIATFTQQIIINSSEELLKDPLLPLATRIHHRVDQIFHKEENLKGFLKSTTEDTSQVEAQLQEEWLLIVRDIYAFYPLLIKYVDLQRAHWLKHGISEAEELYKYVAEVFNIWSLSQYFRREETNFISQHEIDNMTLIMPSSSRRMTAIPETTVQTTSTKKKKRDRDKKRDKDKEIAASLMVACLKRLLPVGLNLFAGREQELVQHAKEKFLKREADAIASEYVKNQLLLPEKIDLSDAMSWQHQLYSTLGNKNMGTPVGSSVDQLVERIIAMAKVLFGLHMIDHPQTQLKGVYRSVVSIQRKRAVIECFRQTSLHSLPRHKAINIFLRTYRDVWLHDENQGQEILIEDLTQSFEEAELKKKEEEEETSKMDPLMQLIVAFCRNATTEHSGAMQEDKLYMAYADIISRSCSGSDEEEEEEGGEDEQGTSIHEQEMEKQKLLFEQARLADRGVAEMALLHISACKGVQSPMVMNTLQMGISILRGGNKDIQLKMLQHLKDKKDVGFFTSVAGLMNSCSVLDLDAFERNMKAEGLGVGSEGAAGEKNMHDADFTRTLFRFLQLLCEGHNLDFQNYLRTQAGNTTTVNVVICTVDYLLRLQESIMDFYWHYSSKEVIDQSGKNNFFKAIDVAKQVFNTLTEFIQGPCTLNQQALAHSRLWDAVGGFMFLFAHMQDKLSKHSSQVDLLKELLNLQKDMVIMMLSMLEGNVMNGTIGKQMVDTLVESASNVEMLLMFFNMFLKLESLTASPSFREMDTNKDGFITPRDFQKAMEQQKTYTEEEIQYIMQCCDTNHDGKIDYIEFTERFHEPAKDIGFNLAVLLTNLSEHMPNEPRLARFLESASSVLNYFEPYLGRIEIMGSSKRIERVYFEIKESNIEQWEKPQIKESKRAFFYSIVTEGGDKEKLEAFVNFCEDAIFEMQHASSMSAEEGDDMPINRAAAFRYPTGDDEKPQSALEPVKVVLRQAKDSCKEALSHLTPANIKKKIDELKEKTFAELVVGFFKLLFYSVFYSTWTGYFFIRTIVRFIMLLMRGQPHSKEEEKEIVSTSLVPVGLPLMPLEEPSSELAMLGEAEAAPPIQAFGIDITKEDDGYHMAPHETPPEETPQSSIEEPASEPGSEGEEGSPPAEKVVMANGELVDGAVPVMANHIDAAEDIEVKEPAAAPPPSEIPSPYAETKPEPSVATAHTKSILEETEKRPTTELPPMPRIDVAEFAKKFVSFLARHFYNMKYIALVLAFAINFILLFYKVTTLESGDDDGSEQVESISEVSELEELGLDLNATDEGEGEDLLSGVEDEDEELEEWITVEEKVHYLQPTMTILAALHSLVSFFMLVAYYHLKVPLAIFKREKEIARRLEFDGLYIAEQPAEDDVRSHWDKLVISARSFPVNYWDKFVKKKVRQKYSETYDFDAISNMLGMEKSGSFSYGKEGGKGVLSFLTNIDWRYQIWKAGVTITDNSFLYILWYFTFSVLGNFNNFFFAAHLLDVAVGFKTLRTILQSVTHNGKQLILTVMLLTIIVYIYTVIAFNFFRKFYIQEEDEQVDRKCHDMLTCFVFHLYKGVRAGGGIGDEIEPPDGDDYEVYRIVFDITFFFFVIVILLAIIQGLIIDAFGELRDQLQSVQDDMESNCFICTIGKDYFDKVPHGFDTHVQKEHNLANYMFFLMHLINKPDTEYTGQETYVWEMYQERCWDFFPVGDCFRKQYEDELGSAG
uniref:Ryanodine receptor 44F n=1 Tax=Scolopendra viridis TaxID=118503 RepID=A0A4D5R9V0_SCOVI